MYQRIKPATDILFGVSIALFTGATVPPLMIKWHTTLIDIIRPNEPLFKSSKK
jgi:hypothetical protein